MSEIVMPRLSDTMEEGTILRWLKHDGDHVARGEELVEIETDKAAMTYESDSEGILQTVASEGDTLAVGEPIARIGVSSGRCQRGWPTTARLSQNTFRAQLRLQMRRSLRLWNPTSHRRPLSPKTSPAAARQDATVKASSRGTREGLSAGATGCP